MKLSMTKFVVLAQVAGGNGQVCGMDIMRATGHPSGTVYPCLEKLLAAGLVSRRQEKGNAEQLGRPKKRFYRVTAKGQRVLDATRERLEV